MKGQYGITEIGKSVFFFQNVVRPNSSTLNYLKTVLLIMIGH